MFLMIGNHTPQTRPAARAFLCALWAGILANLVLYASILHVLADLFCWIGVVILLNEIPVSRPVRRLATAAAKVGAIHFIMLFLQS